MNKLWANKSLVKDALVIDSNQKSCSLQFVSFRNSLIYYNKLLHSVWKLLKSLFLQHFNSFLFILKTLVFGKLCFVVKQCYQTGQFSIVN